jgi:hypothetical protein
MDGMVCRLTADLGPGQQYKTGIKLNLNKENKKTDNLAQRPIIWFKKRPREKDLIV